MPVPTDSAGNADRQLIADEIYTSLRDMIIVGELLPGEPLREVELAEYFQVSRTPVHEAIGKLGRFGFAELLPQRGGRVSEISASSLRDLLQVNTVLLLTLTREALPLLTADDRKRFARIASDAPKADQSRDRSERLLAAVGILAERYGNGVLADHLTRTWPHILRAFAYLPEAMDAAGDSRAEVLDALRRAVATGDIGDFDTRLIAYRRQQTDALLAAL
ncbi:GntR family transcriptional regulator, partial [Leucobacter sp. M11]|uniref:GntR family transcriptional regulator n=1 Tax=Leucobacter sp. M11 TaxID=2993565 RepID=UPI002D7EBB59